MGKRRTLSIVLAIIGWSAQAQVSLDSSEFPLIGTEYALANVAFVNVEPPSAPGPDQNYDFGGGFIYDGQFVQYFDANFDPFSADYPLATLARYIPGNFNEGGFDQHFLYDTDVSGFWLKGMVWVGFFLDTIDLDTLYFDYNAPNEDTLLSDLYSYGYSDSTYALSEMLIWFGATPVNFDNHLYKK